MNCHESHSLIQRRLDGEPVVLTPAWEGHLAGCIACRQDCAASQFLLDGLRDLKRPTPPERFNQRLVAAVLRDRVHRQMRTRRRWWVTAGLAASILLMVSTSYLWLPAKKGDKTGPIIVDGPRKELDPSPPLSQSVAQAKDALASWSTRMLDQTEQAKQLLAAAGPIEVPMAALGLDDSIPPDAAQSLLEAGQGVSEGLQVMARNARRAVEFFKDLPLFDLGPN
jgi:hypothetical protein